MAKYIDKDLLEKIGKRLQKQRKKNRYLIVDVASKTGFSSKTIKDIESGNETSLSYFTEVCKALRIHPKEIYDFTIDLKPRFEHVPPKNRITSGVEELIEEGYFSKYRTAEEVKGKLKEHYEIETTTSSLSVILGRQVEKDKLTYKNSDTKGPFEYIKIEKSR